jgi:hypothetical protein
MRIKVHAHTADNSVSITREFGQEWSASAWMQAMTTLYGPSVKFGITTTVGSAL